MNKQELENRRTNLIEELDSDLTGGISELDELNDDLTELHDLVESLEERYEELPEDQKQGLSEAIQRVVREVREIDSPSRLLDYESDIKEAYENPIIESVQGDVIEFYEIIGVNLSESEKNGLLQKVDAASQPDLSETRTQTSVFPKRAEALSEPAKTALRGEIASRPSPISDPDEIESLLESIEGRSQSLQQIKDQFESVKWSTTELTEISEFTEFYDQNKDVESLPGLTSDIQEKTDSIPEIVPIQTIIQAHLRNNIGEFKTDPSQVLGDINESLSTITSRSGVLEDIEQLMEIVDLEQNKIQFLSSLEDIRSNPPDDLHSLSESIESICFEFESWKDELAERWEAMRPVIRTYEQRLDLNPPDQVSEYSEQSLPLENQIATAYSTYIRADSWIDSKQDDVLQQASDEAQQLFHELSSKGELQLSKDDLDAIEEIIEIIDLKIVIDE